MHEMQRNDSAIASVLLLLLLLAVAVGAIWFITAWLQVQPTDAPERFVVSEILRYRAVAIIGVPAAAVLATIVILLLRISHGPYSSRFGAGELSSSATAAALWLFVFGAIVVALKAMWG